MTPETRRSAAGVCLILKTSFQFKYSVKRLVKQTSNIIPPLAAQTVYSCNNLFSIFLERLHILMLKRPLLADV